MSLSKGDGLTVPALRKSELRKRKRTAAKKLAVRKRTANGYQKLSKAKLDQKVIKIEKRTL